MSFDMMQRVSVLIKKAYYAHERYHVPATFAMLYHEDPLDVKELANFIRISDQVMKLDPHHYFIIFAFTSAEDAYKASQNILLDLDAYFNNRTSCIALDSFDPTLTPQNVINRLKQIVSETQKHSFIRIETEEILDR